MCYCPKPLNLTRMTKEEMFPKLDYLALPVKSLADYEAEYQQSLRSSRSSNSELLAVFQEAKDRAALYDWLDRRRQRREE